MEELKIDSLSMIELFFNIEDEFKVTLPSEDVKLNSLGDVVAYIDQLVAVQHRAKTQAGALTPPGAGAAAS
jgi:hypothetical protein